MKKLQKIFLSLAICLTVFAIAFVFRNPQNVSASVNLGNDYHSTTTRTAIVGVPYTQLTSIGGQTNGTLGSVVITGANTGTINIYDGTSTNTNTQTGTTSLAVIPASTVAGTYTFDVNYRYGLVIEVTGLAPTTTITYR